MEAQSPWIQGLIDALSAAKLILNTNLETKNRIALIILDSTLEIGFKNYLHYVVGIKNLPENVMKNREDLHKVVKKHIKFPKETWEGIDYFYERRNDLYHEESGLTIPEGSIFGFFTLVIAVVDELFSINSQSMIKSPEALLVKVEKKKIAINETETKAEAVIAALGSVKELSSAGEIKEILERMGYNRDITTGEINTILHRKSYKHYFYYDKEKRTWLLSEEGQDLYYKILIENRSV